MCLQISNIFILSKLISFGLFAPSPLFKLQCGKLRDLIGVSVMFCQLNYHPE